MSNDLASHPSCSGVKRQAVVPVGQKPPFAGQRRRKKQGNGAHFRRSERRVRNGGMLFLPGAPMNRVSLAVDVHECKCLPCFLSVIKLAPLPCFPSSSPRVARCTSSCSLFRKCLAALMPRNEASERAGMHRGGKRQFTDFAKLQIGRTWQKRQSGPS